MGKCLPSLSSRDLIRALRKAGFTLVDTKRGKGSHQFLFRDDPQTTLIVPKADTVQRGTLRAIIKAAGLSVDEFLDLLS